MTTKELINQYVTAHADNRWMDASELETLLTEFAEKLKEPASEVLLDASNNYCLNIRKGYPRVKDEIDIFICNAFKAGAEWQKTQDQQTIELAEEHAMLAGMMQEREQMMKDAVEGRMELNHIVVSYAELAEAFPTGKDGDKVKVVIIKD